MKNLSLMLNVALAIALAILYYLHFSSQKSEEKSTTGITENYNYDIAYINADSVLRKYDYFDEVQEVLQGKSKKLEAEYASRAQGLQKEVADYQRNISNLTIGQAKALEENLVKKQQNLRLYQEQLTQELLKEEGKINQELYEKVSDFLAKYGEENDLKLVVKFNQGSDILFAADSLNITDAVINGLNQAYADEKNKPANEEAGVDSVNN